MNTDLLSHAGRSVSLSLVVLTLLSAMPAIAQQSRGGVFHIHPTRGQALGEGSATRPWRTLAEASAKGALAKLAGGDCVLLYDGNHGVVSISGGPARGAVRIEAAKGAKPRLARLVVKAGRGWHFKGLTISPSFLGEGEKDYRGSIVDLGDKGPSSDLVLEDCFIYNSLDVTQWTVEDWKQARHGIWIGRHSNGLIARNNHVLNTRHAISLCGTSTICEGNIVENISGDGIRVTRDGIIVRHNVVKNAYCSEKDGDPNHDDAIQCFLFNKGKGKIRNVRIEGNIIINREDDRQRFPTSMQAIGFFSGPLIDFVVVGNVVLVAHWHGVSLYDAQNCRIENNVCFSRWTADPKKPWIQLGKRDNQPRGNTVRNNFAHAFKLKTDRLVQQSGNRPVTAAIFAHSLRSLARGISRKYGKRHPVSDRKRLR